MTVVYEVFSWPSSNCNMSLPFRFRVHEAIGPGLLHEITAIAESTTATAVAGYLFGLLVKTFLGICELGFKPSF